MTQCGGFQFLLILDPWDVSFHAAVVFGLGKDSLFKSTLGHFYQSIVIFKDFFQKILQCFSYLQTDAQNYFPQIFLEIIVFFI